MTEASNELCLVQRTGSLLHLAHECHLVEPFEQIFFCDANVESWGLCAITTERIFIESNGERMGAFSWMRGQCCAVCRCIHRLDGTSPQRLRSDSSAKDKQAFTRIISLTICRDNILRENGASRADIESEWGSKEDGQVWGTESEILS